MYLSKFTHWHWRWRWLLAGGALPGAAALPSGSWWR
jgi:hypothetical protein